MHFGCCRAYSIFYNYLLRLDIVDIEKDFGDGYFESGYGKIHYKKHVGDGPVVVFLHGLAGSIKTWTRLVKYLPESLNVYLVDLLGHGDSDAPDIEYTFKNHYEAVSGLVGSLGLKGYFVFGHSYGGWIAAYMGIQDSPAGVILEDSAGLKDFYEERISARPEYKEELIKKARELNPHEKVIRSMLDADNGDELLTRMNLEAMESKTLIIWGGMDSTVDKKYAYEFKKYIFRSRLELLPGERHTPHYTNPYAVARLILGFVNP